MKLIFHGCLFEWEQSTVAFTPKGGCPLKLVAVSYRRAGTVPAVAFTPKGGCPLKLGHCYPPMPVFTSRSIHPQGWVPVETDRVVVIRAKLDSVAFTPKGGCPLKPSTEPT